MVFAYASVERNAKREPAPEPPDGPADGSGSPFQGGRQVFQGNLLAEP